METIIQNKQREKAVIRERLNQWINAIQLEDADLLADVMSDDPEMVFFGTDVQERWIGKEDFIAAQKAFFQSTSDSRLEVYNITIQISESGTVAWTSCMMNWDIKSGDQPVHLEGIRLTVVFEKRGDRWVAVQGHGSIPPSGQSIEY